jgi:hypothetical protein
MLAGMDVVGLVGMVVFALVGWVFMGLAEESDP